MITDKNAKKFTGFSDIYDAVRPACPVHVTELLTRYLGRRPKTVVDLGCGTGLSARVWLGRAGKIIGVEPSDDMRTMAEAAQTGGEIIYIGAFADRTGLKDGIADIVTCSQSFHWMEPASTLREINRLLVPGGVFAAYDYDWPPVATVVSETAYLTLDNTVERLERENPRYKDLYRKYDKDRHLEQLRNSGYFTYTREILFSNTEPCDAERYIGMSLSRSGLQAIWQREPALIEEALAEFKEAIAADFGGAVHEIEFGYRLRLGVKE